ERNAAEDRRRKEEIEERNRADALVYQADRTLADFGARVSPELRMSVENTAQDLRTAIRENNISRIRTLVSQLEQELQRAATAVNEQAAAAGAGAQSGPASGYGAPDGYTPGPETYPREEGTVEGEYREL